MNKPNVWEALADVFVARREERELADARRLVFSDDPAIAEQASRDVARLKAELMPAWQHRSDSVQAKREERGMPW